MTAAAEPVGKAALAHTLGWSRPKLDRRLESDPHFPVVQRGDQSGGWKFDPAAVRSYLDGKIPKAANGNVSPAKAAPAIDQAQLRDAVAPPTSSPPRQPTSNRRSAHHQGEATARQRKDAADAALRENKLRIENAELVDRGELRQQLANLLASLGTDLDAIPDAVAQLLNLPDEAPRIRELIDKIRIQMVANASSVLSDD